MKQKSSHPPYGFKERFLYFSLVQVNLACTELILKEANTANEGFFQIAQRKHLITFGPVEPKA